ncbi:MHO_1590 family protein [Mesomycoplasma ovipneumoniae]|uniref:MHO_1590 family protein n=1 Tax=Mesomycoplasma ovipneumoniae TaxID=29562 RepID=UPI0039F50B5B
MQITAKILSGLFATGIIVGGGILGWYLYNSRVEKSLSPLKKQLDFEVKNESEYKENDVFPNIYANDFYDTIKVKQGKVYIDEWLVENLIKEIISKVKVSFGSLNFRYKIDENQQTIYIEILWKYKKNKLNRNYKISLYQDI